MKAMVYTINNTETRSSQNHTKDWRKRSYKSKKYGEKYESQALQTKNKSQVDDSNHNKSTNTVSFSKKQQRTLVLHNSYL